MAIRTSSIQINPGVLKTETKLRLRLNAHEQSGLKIQKLKAEQCLNCYQGGKGGCHWISYCPPLKGQLRAYSVQKIIPLPNIPEDCTVSLIN